MGFVVGGVGTMGDNDALLIAVAGGSGAFIGAVIGQIVQWLRDTLRIKVEDRRRSEDRQAELERERREVRREGYISLLQSLSKLRSLGGAFVMIVASEIRSKGGRGSALRKDTAKQLDELILEFSNRAALASAVGSEKVNAQVWRIESSLTGIMATAGETIPVTTVHDRDRFWEKLRDREDPYADPTIATSVLPDLEKEAEALVSGFLKIEEQITALRAAIRAELKFDVVA